MTDTTPCGIPVNTNSNDQPFLLFSNPTELDPRLITTFGASIKDLANPIGQFGTGLKYAIAFVLRSGGSFVLWSGLTRYEFGITPTLIRGQTIQIVTMTGPSGPIPCGFTTSLGAHWLAWMAYRELWSNAQDEGGTTATGIPVPSPNTTIIQINCPALTEVHAEHDTYFIDPRTQPLWTIPGLEIYGKAQLAPGIYYRGIRVCSPNTTIAQSKFRYNLTDPVPLTEDRTLDSYSAIWHITKALARCSDRRALTAVLNLAKTDPQAMEFSFGFDSHFSRLSDTWFEVAEELKAVPGAKLSLSAIGAIVRRNPNKAIPRPVPLLLPVQTKMLSEASQIIDDMGLTPPCPVTVSAELPDETVGRYYPQPSPGVIVLGIKTFDRGLRELVLTLMEESLHARTGAMDFTREFQEALIKLALSEYCKRTERAL